MPPGGADRETHGAPGVLTLPEKLDLLPREPGVYRFLDDRGKVIYIGKAKSLRNRVRSYFTSGPDGRYQYELLVSRIHDLEVIVTDTELEALILEANLIRRHRPRFNVDVRDDRTYPFLKVTREPCPRVFLTRVPREDGAAYYGPLSEVTRVKETLAALRKACKVRTCNLKITQETIARKKHKICLEYHLGNCEAPCVGYVSLEEYNEGIRRLVETIHGRSSDLIGFLERRMKSLAADLKFEEAARVRDQIAHARTLSLRQKVLSRDAGDRDVFGFAQEDREGCVVLLKVRGGRMIGREHRFLSRLGARQRGEVLARVLADTYVPETRGVPNQILLPEALPEGERETLHELLNRRRGRRVELRVPRRGDRAKLVELACHNAELLLKERLLAKEKAERVPHGLSSLREHLHLPELPRVIECFDNSNLFGTHPVAAMVQFRDARPAKSQYRHYRIRGVEGIDDFASMREVVGRRYRRLLAEGADLPDLVLIDGGIGQVNAARKVLDEIGLQRLPVAGLAKRLEEIVLPGSPETITLPKTSSALKLLMRVRDEAHRFAVTYHRKLRSAAQVSSSLVRIPGIGEAKARALLRHFGSLARLKQASPEQIAEVPGFSVEGGRRVLAGLGALPGGGER